MTDPAQLQQAVDALRRGGLVAYPTEAVWGLGCDPFDEAAVLRLLALKQREVAKGPAAIDAELARLAPVVEGGGFIPCIDHAIHPDVSYEDFLYYLESKRRLLGS